MRRETFCEILGDLDARYVQEAGSARGAGRSHRLKWGAAAACLCLLLVLPLTAFAVDTLQYNAAVEYLTSLGIPAAYLRGYSRSEVKEANDRFANIQVSYILQRIEDYDGVVLLATNLKKNIDEAFMRRMRYVVEFQLPGEAQREELLKRL